MDIDRGLGKKRNEFLKESRKQHLNQLLGSHRKTIKEQISQFQQQEFNRIYPEINQDNFQQHLPLIFKYSFNDNYNYRLVAFGGYLYDFILANPQHLVALQVLGSLSCFQELEIPHTEQLCQILIRNLFKQKKLILQIVYNLFQASRYCDTLRDYLLQLNFTDKVEQAFSSVQNQESKDMKEYLQELYVSILCLFISSQPLMQEEIFEQMIKKALKFSGTKSDQLTMLIIALSDLVSSINENDIIAKLILTLCDQIMIKQYYTCEYEVLTILFYGVRSSIMISKPYYKLISTSLEGDCPKIKEKIVAICESLLKQTDYRQELKQMFRSHKFARKLVKSYQYCKQDSKLMILQILTELAESIMVQDEEESNKQHSILDFNEFSTMIKDGVQSYSNEIKEKSVNLLLMILQIVDQKQLSQVPARQSLEQQGVFELLATLKMQHDNLSQKIECILRLSKIEQQGS